MTRSGIELRRNIRADLDANPELSIADLRRKYKTTPIIVASALSKTVDEWTAMIDSAPASNSISRHGKPSQANSKEMENKELNSSTIMPGLEQGIVKFMRKPAKMGEDFIFWIPRVYIKNGLVDPSVEYEIYLKKKQG